ncbi:MAG: hypothetical protein ABSF25_09550 [Bryobacteraceae bacterium]|jgi:hypothetical protein
MRLLALVLAASAAASGADRDFDRLVGAVESHLGVKRTNIPLLGAANFLVKTARPEGAAGFNLAVFENLRSMAWEDGQALDGIMAEASAGLHPLVRVRSRRDCEWTYIYTGDAGKTTTMLIAAFERNQATIVEVRLSMDALVNALKEPRRAGKSFEQAP